MFQIPDDDDDEFWSDMPLDVGNKDLALTDKENLPQLRMPNIISTGNAAKKITSNVDRDSFVRANGKEPDNHGECNQNTNSGHKSLQLSASNPSTTPTILRPNDLPSINKQSVTSNTECNPVMNAVPTDGIRNKIGQSNVACSKEIDRDVMITNKEDRRRSRSGDSDTSDYITPKRRRKFPGPAGILPQLGPGKSFNTLSPSMLNNTSPSVNRPDGDDSVVVCSQTSDDVFNDPAWLALLSDLSEDGQKLLKKFSITSTLHKAGKKQLDQGKAGLIFGVIESIESHGSEASVNIRDKSGRMQGTVHRELLKEYETEFQTGTVLVLKQVSIISLSNRNHYLNITPNNIVALYYMRQNTLKSRMFHGSMDSLCSVLSALEKKADANQLRLNSSSTATPSGSSRQSPLSSNCNTPQLFRPSPLLPDHQNTPSDRTSLTSQSPVTMATMRGNNNTPSRNVSLNSGASSQMMNSGTSTQMMNRVSHNPSGGNLQNHRNSINNLSSNGNQAGVNSSGRTYMNNNSSAFNSNYKQTQPVSVNSKSNSKWKFKSPPSRSSSVNNSPNVSESFQHKQNNNVPSVSHINNGNRDRMCQLTMSKSSIDTRNSNQSTTTNVCKTINDNNNDDLWEDDLSDEILSQLSEDFT
ncbi:hypothetical protein ACF0H5_014127 [Mactra antiquata]